MTLRERLEAAAAERRRAAGLPPTDEDESTLDLTTASPIIDVRPSAAPTPPVSSAPRAPSFSGGIEVSDTGRSCPNCGGSTRLDMQDTVGGVDHYSCLDCGLLFQVAR
jgi:predicted RNA-binding Zn-ribbon protein involved in translation (DUF1610 family)